MSTFNYNYTQERIDTDYILAAIIGNGNLPVIGTNATFSGTLTVGGMSSLNGGITSTSGVRTFGNSTFIGLISGDNLILTGTLDVAGMTSLQGGITSITGVRIFGDTTMGILSAISANLSSTLDVTGLTTLSGGLTSTVGNTNLGTTTVGVLTGTSSTFSGALTVNGLGTFTNGLTSTGGITTLGTLTGSSATFSSSLTVTGNTNLSTVTTGAITATSGTFSGTLGVTGLATLNGGITSTAGVRTFGATTFTGAITGTSASLSTTLAVTGLSTFTGGITVGTGTPFTVSSVGLTRVQNTTNATSATSAALVVDGGLGVAASVYIGSKNITPNIGDITAQTTFTGAQNASAANVNGLLFNIANTRTFEITLSVIIDATNDLYATFKLKGIYNGLSWYLVSEYIGDNTLVTFSITNAGQVTYNSTTYPGFVSLTMKFKALSLNI